MMWCRRSPMSRYSAGASLSLARTAASPFFANMCSNLLHRRLRTSSSRKRLFGEVIVFHGTFFNQFLISWRKKRDAPVATKPRLNGIHVTPHCRKDEIATSVIRRTCADKAEKAWFVADNLNGRRREFFRQSTFTIWSGACLEQSENWYTGAKFVSIRAGHIGSF